MRRLRRGALLIGLAVALTAPSAQASPSFVPPGKAFGFTGTAYPSDEPPGSPRTLDAAQAAGAEYFRIGIGWRGFEQDSHVTKPVSPAFSKPVGQPTGNWELDKVDKLYLDLVGRGMKPILMIVDAPAWASTFYQCLENPVVALDAKKCPKDWRSKARVLYASPDRFDAFRAFVSAVVRRYPNAIIEGTNEPDYWQQAQPQYAPTPRTVALGQCALAGAVRTTDPTRKVLSPGLYVNDYIQSLITNIGQGHNCWHALSYHLNGSTDVRSGFASSFQDQMAQLRLVIGTGKRIFFTETGLSDTVAYNDNTQTTGERLVSRAYPQWVKDFLNLPESDGVLLYTVRQQTPGSIGTNLGFGLLNPDFSVKDPGPGVIPRFCYLVLSSGKTYPGCESYSLPGPASPAAPTFFKPPELIWSKDTNVGDKTRVIFLEEGEPRPNVRVTWLSCNAVGTNCNTVLTNHTQYFVQSSDRFRRIKVEVTISNSQGSVTAATALSPTITS